MFTRNDSELATRVGAECAPPGETAAVTSPPIQEEIREARDSLGRCVKDPAFFDRFYELFMASSEEIRKKFENTDFDRQKKMLQDSLFLMLVAAGTRSGIAHRELVKLADRHGRKQLGIKPEWYEAWMHSLLQAVSEHDPDYRPELSTAWQESLRDCIRLMRARY
jgi:hemoglobin-like flavoprotein